MTTVTAYGTAAREQWTLWLAGYGLAAFYDAFMVIAQDAQSECTQCGQPIYLDIREGGGIPDWYSGDGDYGCDDSPDTNEDGVGSHVPLKRVAFA